MPRQMRKQGEGSLFQRKDGRWEGRVMIGYNEKGNPKTKSVFAHTKGECEEKLERLKAECGRRNDRMKPDMNFELDELPESTSLERGIKSLYKNGGAIYETTGFFLK